MVILDGSYSEDNVIAIYIVNLLDFSYEINPKFNMNNITYASATSAFSEYNMTHSPDHHTHNLH